MYTHPECLYHSFLLSLCAISGQLFIFYTIKEFDAIIFVSIMTSRQILSLYLSIIHFDHHIHGVGFAGLALVSFMLVVKIYQDLQKQQNKKKMKLDEQQQNHHSKNGEEEEEEEQKKKKNYNKGMSDEQQQDAVELQRLLPKN